jgi:transcription-repair coupling factor (superfamily II helicase)
VGFETYVRMVREAVLEQQGREPPPPPLAPEVEFPADAYLPESYVEDALQRTTLYQRIARLPDLAAVADMEAELADRFGPPPEAARMLLRNVEARLACLALGLRRAEIREGGLVLTFSPEHMPGKDTLGALAARTALPSRFLYGDPLQLRVELPRRLGPEALTEAAASTLRQLSSTP